MAVKERSIHAHGSASIQTCNGSLYTDYGEGAGPGMNEVPLTTLGSIYSGIFQTQSPNSKSILMNCPTGNCTFPPYQSLGFCSRCANITDLLTTSHSGPIASEQTYHYKLPNGFTFETAITGMNMMNATSYRALSRLDTKGMAPIVNFTAISASGYGIPAQVSATECYLSFCVNTYEANVQGGAYSEKQTSSYELTNSSSIVEDFSITPDTCYYNGTRLQKPYKTDNCTYNVNWLSRLSMANSLQPLLHGSGALGMANRPSWTSNTVHALYGLYGNFTDINSVFQSLASTLTVNARSNICQYNTDGVPWTDQSFVQVRWRWMILPGAMVVLSMIFLAITVVHTRNQYIWKSSPLALLFSEVLVDDSLPLKSSPTLKGMESTSRKMDVLLETTPQGARLKAVPRG